MALYSVKTITHSKELVINLDTVKQFLRIDHDYEDEVLKILIKAATKTFESYTGKAIIKQCLQVIYFKYDAEKLLLPVIPVIEVQKAEINNYEEVWSEIDKSVCVVENNKLYFRNFVYYKNFRITYNAGIATSESEVPEDVKTAVLKNIAYLYDNRGDSTICGIQENRFFESLYKQFRDISLA